MLVVNKNSNNNNATIVRLHQFWQNSIPNIIKTVIIVCLGIPLAHWFLQPYIECDFFKHGQNAIPMIIKIGH